MPKRRFNLVLVRADGTPVLGLAFPRWTFAAGIGGLALLALLAIGSLRYLDDYLTLRGQRDALIALSPKLAEQQALIDLYQRRLRELRAEVDGWRVLHVKVGGALGPDGCPAHLGPGYGGGEGGRRLE